MAKSKKKKQRRNVSRGVAHVQSTFNNTIVTITDANGDTLCSVSGGMVGFKGSRKSTPFAAQRAAEDAAAKASKFGVKEVEVRVKGPGETSKPSKTLPHSRTMVAARLKSDACNYCRYRFGTVPVSVGRTFPSAISLPHRIDPGVLRSGVSLPSRQDRPLYFSLTSHLDEPPTHGPFYRPRMQTLPSGTIKIVPQGQPLL